MMIFQGIFPPGQSATIGVDFMIKTVKVNDDKIKVMIIRVAHMHGLSIDLLVTL